MIKDIIYPGIIHPSVLSGDFVQDLVEIGNKNKIPTVLIMNSGIIVSQEHSLMATLLSILFGVNL